MNPNTSGEDIQNLKESECYEIITRILHFQHEI